MPRIYADNAATTKISQTAMKAMISAMENSYGNPSSIHQIGMAANDALQTAREQIARCLGCMPKEIFFTSGGTESDNQAIMSAAMLGAKQNKRHIISTAFEHHAVLHTLRRLKEQGFEIQLLDVGAEGNITAAQVEEAIRPDTCLVTVMFANNEIGTIEPVREIGAIAHRHGILFHTDAVQAMCHVPINVTEMNIDLLSASAHKFHGPKGVGFMYMKNTAKLEPFIHGGAQERARRAGTSNVPGIVGMGQAVKLALGTLDKDTRTIINMRNYIVDRILGEIPDVTFDGPCIDANADVNAVSVGLPMCSLKRLPSNMHFCFKDVSGDSLLIMLDMNGICASSGSACAAGSIDPSHVLLAIGRSKGETKGALRLSIDKDLTKEDADYAIDALKAAVARLRR